MPRRPAMVLEHSMAPSRVLVALACAALVAGCGRKGSGGSGSTGGSATTSAGGSGGTTTTSGSTAGSSTGSSSSGSGSSSGSTGSGGMCAHCLSDADCANGHCETEGVSTVDWFCAPTCDPTAPNCPADAHCFSFPSGPGCYPVTATCLPPAGSSSGSTGTTGSTCAPDGTFAGVSGADCCSNHVDANGYCREPGYTYTSPPHAGPGPCPENIPDIDTGLTAQGGRCGTLSSACPPGFSCKDTYCVLNGGAGPVQVTLSWDYPEDLDLHVIEPQDGGPEAIFSDQQPPCIVPDPGTTGNQCANGFPSTWGSTYTGQGCEIWYGNIGPRPGDPSFGDCNPVGWLDRDSDPGCGFDGVNIENVVYTQGVPAPVGTYMVRVDFYADCDGDSYLNGSLVPPYPEIPYAVQVRSNGQVALYCDVFTPSQEDNGSEGSGGYIQSFLQLNIFPDGGLEFPPDAGEVDAGSDAGADLDAGADAGADDGGALDAGADDAGLPDGG